MERVTWRGSGLTFDILSSLFSPFHCPAHGRIAHPKMLTHLSQRIVPTPIRLSHAFVSGFISTNKVAVMLNIVLSPSAYVRITYAFGKRCQVPILTHIPCG